jgi:DNA-binding NarL/FixJ family response regulator
MNPSPTDPIIAEAVRVMIADDHPVLRYGLRALLEAAGLQVIAEANTGVEAVEFAIALRPQVVLMDLDMPDMDGLEATQRIRASIPEVRILILTMFHDDAALFKAIRAGAHGYLLKNSQKSEIPKAIRAIAAGEVIFGVGVGDRVLENLAGTSLEIAPRFPELTSREQEILELLAQRCPNAVIARRLKLRVKTVRNYVTGVLSKIKARDRHEAGQMARDAGFGKSTA